MLVILAAWLAAVICIAVALAVSADYRRRVGLLAPEDPAAEQRVPVLGDDGGSIEDEYWWVGADE